MAGTRKVTKDLASRTPRVKGGKLATNDSLTLVRMRRSKPRCPAPPGIATGQDQGAPARGGATFARVGLLSAAGILVVHRQFLSLLDRAAAEIQQVPPQNSGVKVGRARVIDVLRAAAAGGPVDEQVVIEPEQIVQRRTPAPPRFLERNALASELDDLAPWWNGFAGKHPQSVNA